MLIILLLVKLVVAQSQVKRDASGRVNLSGGPFETDFTESAAWVDQVIATLPKDMPVVRVDFNATDPVTPRNLKLKKAAVLLSSL